MNVRHSLLGFLVFAFSLVLLPESLSACACCALDDQYFVHADKPGSYDLSLLEEIRLGDTANLVIGPEETEPWRMSGGLAGRVWKLTFSDGSRSGTLNLSIPSRMTSYKADIHDGQKSAGGGPLLYKEWRLEGKASGTGLFKTGNSSPTKFVLLFQGRGNNCDASEDYTHWRLEVTGRRTSYVLIGRAGGVR